MKAVIADDEANPREHLRARLISLYPPYHRA